MAECIIYEIADQHGKRGTINVDRDMINMFEAEIDRARLRARHEISDDRLGNVVERRTRRLRRAGGLIFGEREKLLQQVSGAADSRFQRSNAIVAVLRKFDAVEIFSLETECRYRCSKLVRRVRNKPALLLKHRADALKKPINRGDERQQFVRHALGRKVS